MGSFIILLLVLSSIVDVQLALTQTEETKVLRGFRRVPEARMIGKPKWYRRGEYKIMVAQAEPQRMDGIKGEAAELELPKREIVNKSHGNGAKETDSPLTDILQLSDDKPKLAGKRPIPLKPEPSPQNLSSNSTTSTERNDGSPSLSTSDNAGNIDSGGPVQNNSITETNIREIADGGSNEPEVIFVPNANSKDLVNFVQPKTHVEGTTLKSNVRSSSSVAVHTSIRPTPRTPQENGGEEKSLTRHSVSERDKKVDHADVTSPHPVSEERLTKRHVNLTIPKMGSTNNRGSSDYLENFRDGTSEKESEEPYFTLEKSVSEIDVPVTSSRRDVYFNFRNNLRSNIFLTVKIN